MADVSDERGQLFLVGALVLAVLFVSFAMLTNTAVYTENLATRDSDPGTADVVEYREAVERGVGGAIGYVNRHNHTDNSTLGGNFSDAVDEWDNASARNYAATGRVVNATNASVEFGARIAQTNETRNFTNASDEANWTLVADGSDIRAHRLNVSTEHLVDKSEFGGNPDDLPGSGAFHANYTNRSSDDTRSVYVYKDDGSDPSQVVVAVVTVDDGSRTVSAECSAPARNDTAVVDVTGARVAGHRCAALDFFGNVSDSYDLAYRNGGAANGTYSLVVDESESSVESGSFGVEADGDPFVTDAIYAAKVDVTYENSRVYYHARIRVAPGEPDV